MKQKKWLAMLLTVVMVFTIIPITAFAVGTDEYFNVDGIYYQIVDENTKTVEVVHPNKATGLSGAGASSYSGDFKVPAVVTYDGNEYSVVGIDSEAFYAANLTSITLPEGLKYIDGNAFRQSKLTSIYIPSTVETIGTINNPDSMGIAVNPVFNRDNDQVKLTSITFAPNSQLRAIGGGAFQSTGIKTIDLPESLQTIDPYAFSACTELKEIAFPESVTDIYFRAFSGCRSLKELNISADIDLHTESGSNGSRFFGALTGWLDNNYGTVTFGEGSRYAVEEGLFYDGNDLLGPVDKNIESATIREGTELIAPYAFYKCDSLSSVDIPDSLTTISRMSFANCSSLENIDLRNVTTLEQQAFMYSGLKSIVIPEGVTTIPLATFANIDNLSFIKIPSTVTEIGQGAFQKLSMPEGMNVTVIMDSVLPPTMGNNVFRNIPNDSVALIVPVGSEQAYAENEQLKVFVTNAEGNIKDDISIGAQFPEDTTLCPEESFEIGYVLPENTEADVQFNTSDNVKGITKWNDTTKSYEVTFTGEGTVTVTAQIKLIGVDGAIFEKAQVFTVGHGETELKDAKDATCTAEGYTGDKVCTVCGEVVEHGTVIAKLPHDFEDGKCTVCGAEDPDYEAPAPFVPEITVGANSTWSTDSKDGLSFTSNAAFGDFQKVQVDGKDLDASNYTVKEGSTIVTLKAEYLGTLSAGTHTLAIVSETGTATTEFTIKAAATDDESSQTPDADKDDTNTPQTGDDSNMAIWFALLFVSGSALFGATAYSRKKKYSK